jgi:hypothetical protein
MQIENFKLKSEIPDQVRNDEPLISLKESWEVC